MSNNIIPYEFFYKDVQFLAGQGVNVRHRYQQGKTFWIGVGGSLFNQKNGACFHAHSQLLRKGFFTKLLPCEPGVDVISVTSLS